MTKELHELELCPNCRVGFMFTNPADGNDYCTNCAGNCRICGAWRGRCSC
jgi:hypothetical protein